MPEDSSPGEDIGRTGEIADDYARGYALLQRLGGTERPAVLDLFSDFAEDFGRQSVAFVYGQLYHRPGLSLPQRQLATIGILATLGYAQAQLKFHLGAALRVGCSRQQLVEAVLQVASFAGFPATINALGVVKELFDELPPAPRPTPEPAPMEGDRYQRGLEAMRRIDGEAGERVAASLAELAPDLVRYLIEFTFGEVYCRPGLDLREREIVTVAACTALGTAAPQLKVHVHGLLNVGGTRQEALETILHTAAYVGFPAALNGISVARAAFAERD
ncbi:carboxymuconolactone decarboxylase family protein [Amycolatopsis aidingensis]|uniref:carboxymuconolactone decarboxylase family protein n=1 Tax=Amycolatopsis aidingensis TaxID=2842453 RepID=UPI001E2E9E06|nr:carboxymuconolactone decarboxylase family protein [Amycolatopsis aidingensis]